MLILGREELSFQGDRAVYVRVKKIGSKRYAYLVEGVASNGKVRQKTLAYLGPIVKVARGVPDEIGRKVDGKVRNVDWNKINMDIRKIPIDFDELQEIKRNMLPKVLAGRQNRSADIGRGNRPRVDGELAALTIIARRSFNEMFRTPKRWGARHAMSPKRSLSKTYSEVLTPKSFIAKVRKEPNELRRKMLLIGYVTSRLEKKKQSVFLVGGQAVETYTAGQFPTGDIDVATSDSTTVQKVLKGLGFEEVGVIWLNKKLGIAFHIVGYLAPKKLGTIRVGPYKVRIVGVEELILDRLSAAKFWNIPADYEKATVLYDNFKRQIDMGYLQENAKKKKVEESLLRITETDSTRLGR